MWCSGDSADKNATQNNNLIYCFPCSYARLTQIVIFVFLWSDLLFSFPFRGSLHSFPTWRRAIFINMFVTVIVNG